MEFLRDPLLDPIPLQIAYRQALSRLVNTAGPARLQQLGELGQLARQLRDYTAAQAHFMAAVSLARQLQDPLKWAANQVRLGVALHHDGQLDPAIACFKAVLASPDLGYRDFALQHLGKLLVETANYPAARKCFEQALILRQAKAETELAASTQAALNALCQLEDQAKTFGESG